MLKKFFIKRKKWLFILAKIVILVLFWIGHTRMLDPDFGWHVRMGELIRENGIPKTDPFSYTMPSYLYVDHEWLANIFLHDLYSLVGIEVIAFLFVILSFGAVLMRTVHTKKEWIIIPLLLCGAALSVYISGIRLQILSWLFCSVVFLLLFQSNLWQRFRFFLPLLFLLWVNVHGSFVFGIGIVAIILLLQHIQAKKLSLSDWFVWLLCVGVTFITPYGWVIWWEVYMQMSDTGLRWSIMEWFPALSFLNIAFLFYLAISANLIIRYRKKFSFLEWFLYLLLLLFGLSSNRHLPFWLLFSLPLTARAFEFFYNEVKKNAYGQRSFWIAYTFIFVLTLCICVGYGAMHLASGPYLKMYPVEAVRFINKNVPQDNIFSPYNWGGYLIWKLPEKKVFIDGRMPSWRWDASIPGESNYAFEDYRKFLFGTNSFSETTKKYTITTIMLPVEDPHFKHTRIERWSNMLFGAALSDPYFIHKQARKEGWKEVYKDNTAVIYQKQTKK